jgi:hypothetical protein
MKLGGYVYAPSIGKCVVCRHQDVEGYFEVFDHPAKGVVSFHDCHKRCFSVIDAVDPPRLGALLEKLEPGRR